MIIELSGCDNRPDLVVRGVRSFDCNQLSLRVTLDTQAITDETIAATGWVRDGVCALYCYRDKDSRFVTRVGGVDYAYSRVRYTVEAVCSRRH